MTQNGLIRHSPKWIKWMLSLFALAAVIVAAKYFNIQGLLQSVLPWINGLGPWGPIIFILTYVLATVLFVPGSILTLGAGILFGVVWGSIYVSAGSVVGATCAFLIGRYLARDWVAKKIGGNAKFRAIDDAVASEGWKIVGLTRLSPIFPFNLLNYAFSLTKVTLRDYVLGSWIGMMPGTITYVYIGSLAGSLAKLGQGGHSRTPTEWALYGVGLLATVIVTLFVTRLAKKTLAKEIGS